jgi:small subunit ribosomal protein S1
MPPEDQRASEPEQSEEISPESVDDSATLETPATETPEDAVAEESPESADEEEVDETAEPVAEAKAAMEDAAAAAQPDAPPSETLTDEAEASQEQEVEEEEEEPSEYDDDEDVVGASEEEDEDEEEEDDGTTTFRRGQIVEGRVMSTSPTEILVDLGDDIVGVINSRELERLTSNTLTTLEDDSEVLVYVLSPRGDEQGRPVLSISRALEERDWREAEAYFQDKDVYHGKVSGYNKGGLVVRFGRLRGFVPASQISQERRIRASGENPEDRWGDMIGDSIAVKVVELKRSRNRLILSEQAAAREVRENRKANLVAELEVGERRTGRVISLTDFGAFVDIGGADGLVHLTEISWQHITHPKEVLSVGEEVDVEVISVDRQRNRIGLSIRRLLADPWQEVEDQLLIGQLIQATITKLTKFGAFARLVEFPEVEGLIHISELSESRVAHPREAVNVGDVLALRIIKIDREDRRIGLSLKRVDSDEYMDVDWQIAEQKRNQLR